MHLRVDPDMALSRLDVYTAAHCIIRPILLFRKWEEVSRAIFGVNMWWECVEFPPHHFGAAQAHALASRPGHGAESPRRVSCCTLHHSSNIILFRNWEEVSRAIFGVNMWWECVQFLPHHFRAVQAHALAIRPGYGAESPRRVYNTAARTASFVQYYCFASGRMSRGQ